MKYEKSSYIQVNMVFGVYTCICKTMKECLNKLNPENLKPTEILRDKKKSLETPLNT